jgi:RNA polymerase sigma-70 factor (ECF subfamily)
MSGSRRDLLRMRLATDYEALKAVLARRLQSTELAGDALQETWVQLESCEPAQPVRYPQSYLFRIAYNIGLKRLHRERKTVSVEDTRLALDLVDYAPDPAAVAEGRSELALLKAAVEELTPRQRNILFASRLDGISLAELATRHGISQRWVERELRAAVIHCARRLDRKLVQRFGPRPRQGSIKEIEEIEE